MNSIPDYGEPLRAAFGNAVRDRNGQLTNLEWELRDRAIDTMNACAGMADPAKDIAAMRGTISDCMAAMPCGNIRTHTPENLPERISDLASALVAETSENEEMREAIREAHATLLRIQKTDCPCETYKMPAATLAKLQPFIQ